MGVDAEGWADVREWWEQNPPTIRSHWRVEGLGFNKIFENSAYLGMRGY